MRRRWLAFAPLAILGLMVFIAIGGLVVRLLWNWLLPPLFGWPQITFWQAVGILALSRILFGGFGGRGFHRPGLRRHLAERWEHLTPEERERFRHGLHGGPEAGPGAAG